MGKFKLESIKSLEEMKIGDEIEESDFSHFRNNDFFQWKFIDDSKETPKLTTSPGIWKIDYNDIKGMFLSKTSFTSNINVLKDYTYTEQITTKIDKFLSKVHIYEEYGVFPKRGMLIYGPAGTGKSLLITEAIEKYTENGETTVIVWPTDKFRSRDVKSLLQDLEYIDCKNLIFIAEDIGGVEASGYGKQPVESSLLSLLDNVERVFKIPTLIIATTNFPETLLENLSDRPQRFDDVIEVPNPSPDFRAKFLDFFSKNKAPNEVLEEIKNKKYNGFSVAHIKEIVIRSAIYDISFNESLEQLYKQSSTSKKSFQKDTGSMGIK